jgi:hypothetical protein
MAKAILEFNLPEDMEQFMLAAKGRDIMMTLYELDQHLRSETKYAPDTMSQEVYDALVQVRATLNELMDNNNVSFDLIS